MSEKTEKATPHKLKKAKEQGQVSKSIELNTCIFMLSFLSVFFALWPSCFTEIKFILKSILTTNSNFTITVDTMTKLNQFIWSKLIYLWIPFALTGIISMTLSTISQTGFVWTLKPLTPDFKRLDLSKGLKRLFSSKLLFDAVKNSIKLSLSILIISAIIRHELFALLSLIKTSPLNLPGLLATLFSKIVLEILAFLFFIAISDKLYTRWKFAKDNRMTKQEVKDEYKQREGCPKIKAKIKQLQQQLRQKTASLKQVKQADVIITNPTHYAVVLKYDRGSMPAPKVLCKAQGELVNEIKALARKHQIPVIENKIFARALFATTQVNQFISREHFPIAASIFREIYRQREAI